MASHGIRQYQVTFDNLVAQGYQLLDVSGYLDGDSLRYAAIFDKNVTGQWQARHGLNSDQYQAALDDAVAHGYTLTRVAGYGVDGDARFAALWTS